MSSIKELLNIKVIAVALIVLVLIIVGLSLFGTSGNNGDLADVKHIDLNAVSYSFGDSPVSVPNAVDYDDIVSAQLVFSFSPKEDITNVTGIKFSNIEFVG